MTVIWICIIWKRQVFKVYLGWCQRCVRVRALGWNWSESVGFLELNYGGVVVLGSSEVRPRVQWRAGSAGTGAPTTFPHSIGVKCDLRFPFPFLCSNFSALKRKCCDLLTIVGHLALPWGTNAMYACSAGEKPQSHRLSPTQTPRPHVGISSFDV